MNNLTRLALFPLFCLLWVSCKGQTTITSDFFKPKNLEEIVKALSSDEMRGRSVFDSVAINQAAEYIIGEFEKAGLQYFENLPSYSQEFLYNANGKDYRLRNIVGIIPGKTKPQEYILFSAHYDHIGIIKGGVTDSIANGADDNASGVASMIQLARYFSAQQENARTLVFVAFTAEEVGGEGSAYFAENVDPSKIVAMFNLEMVGKVSKFGKNTAYITGFKYSDVGKIMQKNLEGTKYKLFSDPYPNQQLFFRSDNAPLAHKGVPAHTLCTVEIDKDNTYHQVTDEWPLLDTENMSGLLKLIVLSTKTIVNGEDTPQRIKSK